VDKVDERQVQVRSLLIEHCAILGRVRSGQEEAAELARWTATALTNVKQISQRA